MSRVCYIVTSFWAQGELAIAVDFAQRTRSAGHEAVFIIPPSHEARLKRLGLPYLTLIPKSGKLNRIVFAEAERAWKPDAIVLADFLNYSFCERHYGLELDDLKAFSGRLGAFDIYDFEAAGGRVDTYGFFAKGMKELSLDRYDFLLQPCPVNQLQGRSRGFRYSLTGPVEERKPADRALARESLGLGAKERVVLLTSAVWQEKHREYDDAQPFIGLCKKAMADALSSLGKDVRILSVGARSLAEGAELPGLTHYDGMPPEDFAKLVSAADVYVSNNYISTSMAKMVLQGVPTLLLQNSIMKNEETSTWINRKGKPLPPAFDTCSRAYPFRMFPVGWFLFLNGLVKDNPFYSIMKRAELFETEGLAESLNAALAREGRLDETADARRRAYLKALGELAPCESVFAP